MESQSQTKIPKKDCPVSPKTGIYQQMQALDDMALLRKYALGNSEAAFAELVSRRVNFVYSAALRQVRDEHQAGEITQAVFILLAQKAARISEKTILTGWLFRATRFAVLTQLRAAAKRQRLAKELQMQTEPATDAPDPLWEQLSPLLDEALAALGEKDRQAVLLRYFENKSLAEVGVALGTGEDTARKRTARALEKLHRYFSRRGISSTTAVLAGMISSNSTQAAPAALAKSVTVVAVAKGATASTTTAALLKGALKFMAWSNAKTAVVLGTAAVLTVATATIFVETLKAQDDSIDAKIARLSKPGTTVKEAIRVLGEPEKYASGTQILNRNNLPASYQLSYTNGIEVWILNGKVKELESLKPGPGFSYRGKLHLGSTLNEVLQETGPPSETVSGQPAQSILGKTLGGYAGVLYTELSGVKGYGYYWRPDQNVRFIFRNDAVIALLFDVAN
jgi:RNA polymerase sigma factor (sigma-70 family)